jgi:hypothetical protein
MINRKDMVDFAQALGAATKLLPDQVCVMVGEQTHPSGMESKRPPPKVVALM